MMRVAAALCLLAAGCVADNPDYIPPALLVYYNFDAGQLQTPDGPTPDMTSSPDMTPPSDLAPPADFTILPDFTPPPDMALDAMAGCAAGYLNCDGDPANGCEVQRYFNNLNCGACGLSCAAGTACYNGNCVPCVSDCRNQVEMVCCGDVVYKAGQSFACANVAVGDQNTCFQCGSIGDRCCPGKHCNSGTCQGATCR